VMYVNPVIRYNGSALPAPVAPVDPSLTWLGRSLVMMAGVAATLALRQRVAT